MKSLFFAFVLSLFAVAAQAAPFETSPAIACTSTSGGGYTLDHYNVHVGTTVTAVAPTVNTAGLCYFHYDIGALISGLSVAAANTLLATYTVAAANPINQESTAVPFAALPGVPPTPGALTVTAN